MANTGRMLTTAQAAHRMGVSTGAVTYYIRKGVLPARETPGGHYRIEEAELEAFLARQGHQQEDTARIIVMTNQKGGVGKTTLTINLAVLLWQLDQRVLIIDLDPQAHATFSLGLNPDTVDYTIYDAMLNERNVDWNRLIRPTAFGPAIAPINIIATNADRDLSRLPTWGTCLDNVLEHIRDQFDYILIDTGPSLNNLLVNALIAADYVVIPTQLEMLSVRGLQLLRERIDEARASANPSLQIAGVVAMMVQSVVADRTMGQALRQALGQQIRVFQNPIPRSSAFKDVANERSIMAYQHPRGEHTQAYRRLLAELLRVVGGPGREALARPETAAAADVAVAG
jgi:chromosome partitioning protein